MKGKADLGPVGDCLDHDGEAFGDENDRVLGADGNLTQGLEAFGLL